MATLRMLGIGTPRSRWWTIPVPVVPDPPPVGGAVPGRHGPTPVGDLASRPRTSAASSPASPSPNLEAGKDIAAQLRSRGLEAKDIKTVVMTHMHFDHTSAMSELGQRHLHPLGARVGGGDDHLAAVHARLRARRTSTTRSTTAPSASTGPTSTRTRPSGAPSTSSATAASASRSRPGHTHGHMSLICRLKDRDLVIAGDAIYTLGQLDDAAPPPRPEDPHTWRRSAAGAQALQAPVPPGRDHPRARPGGLGGARRPLRVSLLSLSSSSAARSSWRPAAWPARRLPPSALAASWACSSAFWPCSSASCLWRRASRWCCV